MIFRSVNFGQPLVIGDKSIAIALDRYGYLKGVGKRQVVSGSKSAAIRAVSLRIG
jgi:hypothetical protein